jgi:hypothetical protein
VNYLESELQAVCDQLAALRIKDAEIKLQIRILSQERVRIKREIELSNSGDKVVVPPKENPFSALFSDGMDDFEDD